VCSPAGAAIGLAMLAAGAQGETKAEILSALHVDPEKLDETYRSFAALLTSVRDRAGLATRLWMGREVQLRPTYVSLLRDVFRTPPGELNADPKAAATAINQWASDDSRGRIPQIVARLTGTAPVVLASVANLSWQQWFDWTYDAKFSTPPQRTAVAIKMVKRLSRNSVLEADGARLIEVAYGDALDMIVVLPDDTSGLEKIENRLGGRYDEWITALEPQGVDLRFPAHFDTTTALPLGDALKAMGIRHALDGRQAKFADLTSMPPGHPGRENPYLGNAIQNVRIEFTAAVPDHRKNVHPVGDPIEYPHLPQPRPVSFHADHPFMYLVRDLKTGLILFMGRVVKLP
jgi:serpin B